MWLLNTTSITLTEHIGSDVPPYAILSHRWSKDETSFKHLIERTYGESSYGWKKILDACRIAVNRGLDWLWVDTCCIDKSSSRELTEAINSMFAWYRDAVECYAFLDDVLEPAACCLGGKTDHSKFCASEWFQRGWTLQELIAPREVRFYGKDGQDRIYIGDRSLLREQISSACGIGTEHLQGAQSISRASVARRMSWAAERQVTVTEDAAYSLLGIFGVSLPLLYGEGITAFTRLQLAIIAQSEDDSIFAWGLDSKPGWHGMLAPSIKDFVGTQDIYNGPYLGLQAPQATMNAVLHTSQKSAWAVISSCLFGDHAWSRDTMHLGCVYLSEDGRSNAVSLKVARAADGKLYRVGLSTYRTGGWHLPGTTLQGIFRHPKQLCISSRPYSVVAGTDAGRMKCCRTSRLTSMVSGSAFWLRLCAIGTFLLLAIHSNGTCLAESNGCSAAIQTAMLIFMLRDLALNKMQFWVLLLTWVSVSGLVGNKIQSEFLPLYPPGSASLGFEMVVDRLEKVDEDKFTIAVGAFAPERKFCASIVSGTMSISEEELDDAVLRWCFSPLLPWRSRLGILAYSYRDPAL